VTMGYETDLFVKQPDGNLVCDICHAVQQEPTTICKNGHTFCKTCISEWLTSRSNCPDCRGAFCAMILIQPVKNMVMSLRVRCPEKMEHDDPSKRPRVEGAEDVSDVPSECCGWEGTLSDFLEKHCDKECRFRKVKCPHGCRKSLRAFEVEAHKETECRKRKVTCTSCQQEIKHYELEYHQQNKCPETMTSCKDCGKEMLRKVLGHRPMFWQADDLPAAVASEEDQFTGHYKECPKVQVGCEFYEYGCKELIVREDLDEHHSKFARIHARMIAAKFKRMEEDKRWSEENMSWEIPVSRIRSAVEMPNRAFCLESIRVKVGHFQAFLRLFVKDGAVHARVCVDRPLLHRWPQIDRIKVEGYCEEAVLVMEQEQEMERDAGNHDSCSAGGVLRCCADEFSEEEREEERDATLQDFLRWFGQDDKFKIYASFRLSGPCEADERCVGCYDPNGLF